MQVRSALITALWLKTGTAGTGGTGICDQTQRLRDGAPERPLGQLLKVAPLS